MSIQNVELSEHESEFVRRCIQEGHFKDENEVIQAGLQLLEQREAEERQALERLRAEVQKGMDDLEAGRYVEVNSPEELRSLFEKFRVKAKQRLQEGQERVSAVKTQ